MKTKKLLFLILIVAASMNIKAQQINCSSFCITNIQMDSTTSNTMNITLFMGGSNSDFINYPYVSLITNNNGDTLATGTMNFFGQFGSSNQTYSTSTNLDSIPDNFSCTVYFNYDTLVCPLSYPCLTTGINDDSFINAPGIYPNPSSGMFIIQNNELLTIHYELIIYNMLGENVYSRANSLQKKENEIDLSNYPKGIYFVEIISNAKIFRNKIILN